MTDKTALRHLIEAVEGDYNPDFEWGHCIRALGNKAALSRMCVGAYHGSLDAANSLHEALMPGWKVLWDSDCEGNRFIISEYTCYDSSASTEAEADNPARAWLIAILKAYEAQQ